MLKILFAVLKETQGQTHSENMKFLAYCLNPFSPNRDCIKIHKKKIIIFFLISYLLTFSKVLKIIFALFKGNTKANIFWKYEGSSLLS